MNEHEKARKKIAYSMHKTRAEIIDNLKLTKPDEMILSLTSAIDLIVTEIMYQAYEISNMDYQEVCEMVLKIIDSNLKERKELYNKCVSIIRQNEEVTNVQ